MEEKALEITASAAAKSASSRWKEPEKVLCLYNGGHLQIDDEYINDVFVENKSFTFECWALLDKELVYNKNKLILFGQCDINKSEELKTFGLYNLDAAKFGAKDEPRPKYIGLRFYDRNPLKHPVITTDVIGYHHYAVTYDHRTEQRSIYMDGKLVIQDEAQQPEAQSGRDQQDNSDSNLEAKQSDEQHYKSSPFTIGFAPNGNYFGGVIRDVRIWDIVRSEQQVWKCYNQRFMSKLTITPLLIHECSWYAHVCEVFVQKGYPLGVIRLISELHGAGLVVCFPFVAHSLGDIIQGIKASAQSSVAWIKHPDFLPMGYGQYNCM